MNYELQSAETKDIAAALAKAQGAIENALKDSKNPHYRSSFASLASVINAVQNELSKNGIAVVQAMIPEPPMVITTLHHSSGQWVRSYTPLIMQKNDMQGLGAAVTYARRYALSAIVGITQEDDDGESIKTWEPSQSSSVPKVVSSIKPNVEEKICTCGHPMMISIHTPGVWYCKGCKRTEPRKA